MARRLLRVSFGLIWVFDGILQAQISMPLGLAPQVVQPAAAGSPGWVQHLVSAGTTVWSYHPVTAAAAAVWVQVGIGLWLLAAAHGNWSRLAGVASVAWGLVVWVFGEAFGGIFAPGLSWLFGAPGAVLFYCFAGVLVALPQAAWAGPRLGKVVLRIMGAFFVGMALLQAWPGRGFWQGQPRPSAAPGQVTGMVQQMAQTPQPSLLSGWVAAFGRFDAAHGWAVNLFVVLALAGIGAAFLSARPRLARVGVVAGTVLCAATWVLVQDFGFFGGDRHRPQQHGPHRPVVRGRLPGAHPGARCGRGEHRGGADQAADRQGHLAPLAGRRPRVRLPLGRRPGRSGRHAPGCRTDGRGSDRNPSGPGDGRSR